MAEFINTIDVLGDNIVVDSIIERTIPEFKDDAIAAIKPFAFAYCEALVKVDCPNLKGIGDYAFQYCGALQVVSCSATRIGKQVCRRGCTNLMAFALRDTETVPALDNTADFSSASSCKFYVPRALVDAYKAATNWSSLAGRIYALEDYTVDGTVTGDLDETKI